MYQRRIKLKAKQKSFYLITNRITGGSFIFGDAEKEYFRKLLFDGQKRFAYTVWDYVIMDNHYHALIEIPESSEMSRQELLVRWQKYYRLKPSINQGDDDLEVFRNKIHDISLVVGNFQQRFTQWFNKRNNRWGKLFGGRFDSVIVDANCAIAKMMAYITLNPVRAGIAIEPAGYKWSGYAERMALGKLQKNDREIVSYLVRELGLPEDFLVGKDKRVLNRIWDRFRDYLLGHSSKNREADMATIGELLELADMPLKLEWPNRMMLRVRFATKGVAIGSKSFVADVLKNQKEILGYRRDHHPVNPRAWDEIYCLKKHRTWV